MFITSRLEELDSAFLIQFLVNVEQLETHKLLVRYKASVFNLMLNCNRKFHSR